MRLARSGAPVKQIVTGTVCHLEAEMIDRAVAEMARSPISTCSSSRTSATSSALPRTTWREALRLVLLSVTEGEDKPLKYPTIFNTADVAVVTKMDMAEAAEFDGTWRCARTRACVPACGSSRCRRRPARGWTSGCSSSNGEGSRAIARSVDDRSFVSSRSDSSSACGTRPMPTTSSPSRRSSRDRRELWPRRRSPDCCGVSATR